MKSFSKGFVAPGAVIFLAVIGLVAWYRHREVPQSTSTPQMIEARITGEGKTSTIR